MSVAVSGILTDEQSALFPAAQLPKLVSHVVFYDKCLVSSYNTLIDDCSCSGRRESEQSVARNREFHQIFPDVIEPVLRLRVARGYPQEQYEVHNLYTGAARYEAIEKSSQL